MRATIHWKIGQASGHGQPIDFKTASSWVEEMNKKYGQGTHWIVLDLPDGVEESKEAKCLTEATH